MPCAVLKNGVIYPLDPLPPEWTDGKELRVEEADEPAGGPDADDRWFQQLEAMVAQNDPKDVEKLEEALREADIQAKEMVRREKGLP